jgi:hypothetical protein
MLEKYNYVQLREEIIALTMLLNLQTFAANRVTTSQQSANERGTTKCSPSCKDKHICTYKEVNFLKSTYYGECTFEYTSSPCFKFYFLMPPANLCHFLIFTLLFSV